MRRGQGETEERASIEYRITLPSQHNTFDLERVQTLGKRNDRLDESWNDALIKLDDRIYHYEDLFDTLQIKGEFKNKELFSDWGTKEVVRYSVTKTGKDMTEQQLCWENDSIMKLNSYNYNIVPVYNDPDALDF
jgi:AAA+ superfamily predicted ATPase